MAEKSKISELEGVITRFYERYSAQRVALATLVVGILSLSLSLTVYWGFGNALWAALTCLLIGFIGINLAFLTVVPPARSLNKGRNLICEAIRDPSRIRSYNMQQVQLANAKGKVETLNARELRVWTSLVVPYLIESQAQGAVPARKKTQRRLTASERKYIEQRRKEVLEIENKIENERKVLEQERRELERRNADLNEAEELVIVRLSGIEEAEAEIEQLKIVAAERADEDDSGGGESKASELRAKERELLAMKERLTEDRQNFEKQKTDLQRLQENAARKPVALTPDVEAPGAEAAQGIEAREAALEARKEKLEKETRELEKRSDYLTESENVLIERLDALSEREAHVEQSEITAGLRED